MKVEMLNENASLPTMGLGIGGVNNSVYTYKMYTAPETNLSQKPNDVDDRYYIHPGTKVRGRLYNNPDDINTYTGVVLRILKNAMAEIIGLWCMLDGTGNGNKCGKILTLSPDNIERIIAKEYNAPQQFSISPDYMVSTLY